MSKSKSHGKDRKKSAQLVLRVEKSERDTFVSLCEAMDTTAAREIRRFMRDYVARNAPAAAGLGTEAAEVAGIVAAVSETDARAAEVPGAEPRAEAKPASKRHKRWSEAA